MNSRDRVVQHVARGEKTKTQKSHYKLQKHAQARFHLCSGTYCILVVTSTAQ